VFATAGSDTKRSFLRAQGVKHIYSSRSLDFADEILADTDGQGVNIVLNSLADDFIGASFKVLAQGGSFLEIGKRGLWTHEQAEALGRDIKYHIVDWSTEAATQPEMIGEILQSLMAAAARGDIRPLPVRSFSVRDSVTAFQYMAHARHIGKIVLQQPALEPRVYDQGTYLITGGLGALGLRCAKWLVERGARHLVLVGRRAPSADTERVLDALRAPGTHVLVVRADIAPRGDMQALIERIERELPPLRGVFNTAGMLADGTLRQQSWDDFRSVLKPKIDGSWHLHDLTKHLSLDFFVMFSSIASMLGAPGQGNYAAANAFQDMLAYARRSQGLPATSINWGAWGESGLAVREDLEQRRTRLGIGTLSPDEALLLFERVLRDNPVEIAAARMDWPTFIAQRPRQARMFEGVVRGRVSASAATTPARSVSLSARLNAAPESQRLDLLHEYLEGVARAVLGFPTGRHIDPLQPLQELGLDSLMAVEFRNALAAAVERSLPATLLFSYPALDDIAGHLAHDVFGWTTAEDTTPAAHTEDQVLGNIEDLSDEEVDRLFAQRLGT